MRLSGHSIEARITAQDPDKDFAPSAGTISLWQAPGGRNVRLDTYCYGGCTVSPYYDPMIAKLIVKGGTREEAVARLRSALHEFRIEGISTNLPFLRRLVEHPSYLSGEFDTGFVGRMLEEGAEVAV